MRLPAGYGQVVKLSGKRRKPYAVRVSLPVAERSDGSFYKPVKYLEYFEKRSDALRYLSDYNSGIRLPLHESIADLPTFSDVWEGYIRFRHDSRAGISDGMYASLRSAYNKMSDLHHQKFRNLRPDDLQEVIIRYRHQSYSSINNMLILLRGMYKWAIRQEIVEKDYSAMLSADWTDAESPAHYPFTDEEIRVLWDAGAAVPLILIYTGLRGTEFLRMKSANVHLDERYMIGGAKTKAGKNRVIPIHEKIVPFISDMIGGELLFPNKRGFTHTFMGFYDHVWVPQMERLGIRHKPHDARHTCASLLERFDVPLLHRKLILGHTVRDLTEGVYTHVTPEILVSDINKITL